MTTKIILAGPRGKMGSEAIHMIHNEGDFQLVACLDKKTDKKPLFPDEIDVPIYDDAEQCFNEIKADVFIDLTIPEVGYQHTRLALEHEINAVVGTSGFSEEQITDLTSIAENNNIGCIIAPNFALGAVLMMQFSKMAATYFPDVEIIEKHHDNKIDAPSGTATKTVEMRSEEHTSELQS